MISSSSIGSGLVISLPGTELQTAPIPSSVFELSEQLGASVSPQLRVALNLVAATTKQRQQIVQVVARPEMFAHGPAQDWLRIQSTGIVDHLCLSDGRSCKIIPGMTNHIFVYTHNFKEGAEAFQKQASRAPELFAQYSTQINTHFCVRIAKQMFAPPTSLMLASERFWKPPQPIFMRFQLNLASFEDTIAHTTKSAFTILRTADFQRAIYIPLNDLALGEDGFCKFLGNIITHAFFDLSSCVLLRLPFSSSSLEHRVRLSCASLARVINTIPTRPAPNVFFLSDDIDETIVNAGFPVSLIAHGAFDFWRHDQAFLEAFQNITVISSHGHQASLSADWLQQAYGRPCKLVTIDI